MTDLRVITVVGDPQLEADIAASLGSQEVDVVLRCVERSEVLAAIRAGAVDGMILAGPAPWIDAQCIAEARAAGIEIAAVPRDRLDVEQFLTLGVIAMPSGSPASEVLATLRSSEASEPAKSIGPVGVGRLFVVWGPKGAPGRSTVAIELAAAMASVEPLTLLIDADPYGGDLKQLLGVVDDIPSIVWAARAAAKGQLERESITSELRRAGRDGPVLLPGLPRPELWSDVSTYGWTELLGQLKGMFRNVVIDVGFCLEPGHVAGFDPEDGRNRMARMSVASADQVIAVMSAEPIGIKNMTAAIGQLDEITGRDKVMLVANRLRSGSEREVSAIVAQHLKRTLSATIPYEPAVVSEALNNLRSITEQVPGSRVVEAVREIAARCGAPVRPRGLLHRMAGRSR
jgi:MinD-like ATPase involved in chromosome partitioning or flagellar assembly